MRSQTHTNHGNCQDIAGDTSGVITFDLYLTQSVYANVTFGWWREDGCSHWAEGLCCRGNVPSAWKGLTWYFGSGNMLTASRLHCVYVCVCVFVRGCQPRPQQAFCD